MQKFTNFLIDNSGNALSGVSVLVNNAGTSTAATIFSDNLSTPTALANPFTNEADGSFQFYAANGRFDIEFTLTGFTFDDDDTADILLDDPSGGASTEGSILFLDSGGVPTEDNTNLFWHDANNQLRLAATGSSAGVLIGGDALWYRSGANIMRTPDALTVDGATILSGTATITGAASLSSTLTVTGAAIFNGAVTLGNAAGDAIECIGNLVMTGSFNSVVNFTADNARDIGQVATGRPRDVFIGRNLVVGGTTVLTGAITFTATLTVGQGGTGATSFTDGGILLGSGTGAITALGAAANGQIPIGDGTTDPVLALITGTSNEITVTVGAGTIAISQPTNVTIDNNLTVTNDATADSIGIGQAAPGVSGGLSMDGVLLVTGGGGDSIGAGGSLSRFRLTLRGSYTATDEGAGVGIADTVTGAAGADISGLRIETNLATASTGASTLFAQVNIQQVAVSFNGTATLVDAVSLYVEGPPTETGGNVSGTLWAVWVDAGNMRIDGFIQGSLVGSHLDLNTNNNVVIHSTNSFAVNIDFGDAGTTSTFQVQRHASTTLFLIHEIGYSSFGGAGSANAKLNIVAGAIQMDLATSRGIGLDIEADTWDVNLSGNGETVAIGALTFIGIPTWSSTGLTYTVTRAASLYIQGPPAASTNVTLGATHSLWIDAGTSRFEGAVEIVTGGLTVTAGGVVFPATQDAVADVNTLDDYEEGTFTPTVTFTGGSGTITYTTQNGSYTKIGNTVFFRIEVLTSSLASRTGSMRIAGLPFTCNATHYGPCTIAFASGLAITAGETLAAHVEIGTTTILVTIWSEVTGTISLTEVEMTADGRIICGGHYII